MEPTVGTTVTLASSSPRRQALLRRAGYRVRVVAPNVDERRHRGEAPADFVRRLARAKCAAVADGLPATALVLGADTAVVIDGRVLGKPASPAHATAMLRRLAGRRHRVVTGVCLICRARRLNRVRAVSTTVWMRALSAAEIETYIQSGEPLDKAGAYAIQGRAGGFIDRIRGSYSNVVGLPIELVELWLRK